MKIVFLAPFGIRPKGTVIARMLPLAVELQRLGHQVVIVVPPYTNPEDSGTVEEINGVMIRNIVLGPKNKVLAAPFLAWRMFREILREKPDIVHLFKPKGYAGLAGMLFLTLQAVGSRLPPLFLDTDDWEGEGGMNELHEYSFLEKRFYCFQEQWLIRRAVGVTVASRALQAMVGAIAVAGERVRYFPNCVDEVPLGDGVAVRQRLGIAAESPVVLLYTRFFEFDQAKLHFLFAELYRRVPGIRFLVVGKGRHNEEERLPDAARQHGFQNALVMAGWVEPAELPDYLAAGDVAIYPFADTLANRAKCPAKLTELLRAGCPVVADNVGQIAEYIRPGLSGILCNPDDWGEMVTQVAELLRNPTLRREFGIAGRNYLLDKFRWHDFAMELQKLYQTV